MKNKKIIKIKLITIIMCIFLFFNTAVFGRYIYNSAKDLYLTSKKFYFSSDLLNANTPTYTFTNWEGLDAYKFNIELYSYKNELQKLDYDLNYTVTCYVNKPDLVRCAVGTEQGNSTLDGIIYTDTNTSGVAIYVIPQEYISIGEEINISINVTAKGEYEKTISANIKIKTSAQDSRIKIVDYKNSPYAILEYTNFNDVATDVTFEFDNNILNMDLNNNAYVNKKTMKLETINNSSFVKGITFTFPKETTIKIKFYKVDKTMDYTYPKGNSQPIINVIYN